MSCHASAEARALRNDHLYKEERLRGAFEAGTLPVNFLCSSTVKRWWNQNANGVSWLKQRL